LGRKDEPLDYFKRRKYLCREVYDLFVVPGLIQIPESLRFCTYAQYGWIEKALKILPNLTEEELIRKNCTCVFYTVAHA
jgi:hypothetical protein